MARLNHEPNTGRMRDAILVVDGAAPARHFWSRWMDRALAPHESEMAVERAPIPANDIESADGEDPLRGPAAATFQRALRYD